MREKITDITRAMEYELKVCGIHANQKIREAYIDGMNDERKRLGKLQAELKSLGEENKELKDKLENLKKQKRQIQEVQWYNADELPPKEKGYFSKNVLTDTEEIAYYDYESGEWIRDSSSTVIDTPKAWCELPIYKEENQGD